MFQDTIIAIGTPPGCGGLGIVRLSGRKSLATALRIFRPDPSKIVPGKLIFGKLRGPGAGGFFDEAFLTYFKKPHSYTREDVVEISCHGSPVVLEEVVRLGITYGARLARPGEFTLRAYFNGRLDILQAEAVNDLVHAVSLAQARISYEQLGGRLSRKIGSIRERIIRLLSSIEAGIEFPDEGFRVSRRTIMEGLDRLIAALNDLIAGYDAGRPLAEGMTLAIVGKKNVGKSTLFNALLDEERAIVTPYPGTTRDFLRERILIHDAVFNLVDMAGLGRPSHPVEAEGIRRSKKLAQEADAILLVLDGSRRAGREDRELAGSFKKEKVLAVINKIDRPKKFDPEAIVPCGTPAVEVSALKRENIDTLKEMIHKTFVPSGERRDALILHSRQKNILQEILEAVQESVALFKSGHSEELAVESLRRALPVLGRLTGEIRSQEVIDDIFSRFCVGK
jgi:tRNA modification GTPase